MRRQKRYIRLAFNQTRAPIDTENLIANEPDAKGNLYCRVGPFRECYSSLLVFPLNFTLLSLSSLNELWKFRNFEILFSKQFFKILHYRLELWRTPPIYYTKFSKRRNPHNSITFRIVVGKRDWNDEARRRNDGRNGRRKKGRIEAR